jgi:hypothetical protein
MKEAAGRSIIFVSKCSEIGLRVPVKGEGKVGLCYIRCGGNLHRREAIVTGM